MHLKISFHKYDLVLYGHQKSDQNDYYYYFKLISKVFSRFRPGKDGLAETSATKLLKLKK